MPIYEFKCSDCEEFFEVLVMGDKDNEVQCPKCQSNSFERVLSTTSYAMAEGSVSSGVNTTTRSCSGGNCTTYELPGHTKS